MVCQDRVVIPGSKVSTFLSTPFIAGGHAEARTSWFFLVLLGSDVLGPRSKHGFQVLEFASFDAQAGVFIRVHTEACRLWMFFFISFHHSTSQRVSLLFSSELFALRHLSGGTMCISNKVENSKGWPFGSGEPRLRSDQSRL